ncbi:hypothetical protein FisN_17Hu084 [Fistulifera solaris]|uniref:Uncharacterized protein n=1 Tax=Fistulifera solaris TaxID=1519565 RepID=A0A1Z5JGM3_FISSO|nr:hypothetical protein FisN_17Hu084 [Fistulifera solaris]|eukprot:GAX13155.1 hypothetical protein FisN_17Hu084 [Fistulifera solaris]
MPVIPNHPRIVLGPAEAERQVAEQPAEVGRHPADLAGAVAVGDRPAGVATMGRIVEEAAHRVRRALATECHKTMGKPFRMFVPKLVSSLDWLVLRPL